MTEQRFDSVWGALEHARAEAVNMKARAGLMIAIGDIVEGWNVTQAGQRRRRVTGRRNSPRYPAIADGG